MRQKTTKNTFLPYCENLRFSTYSKKPDQKKESDRYAVRSTPLTACNKLGRPFFFFHILQYKITPQIIRGKVKPI